MAALNICRTQTGYISFALDVPDKDFIQSFTNLVVNLENISLFVPANLSKC